MTPTRARPRAVAAKIIFVAFVSGGLGCGSGAPATGVLPGGTFTPFAHDFEGFSSWSSQRYESAVAQGATHVSGTRIVYINHLPAADATSFDTGTVIVKRTLADGKIFARAKRGGTFNPTGAVGWEWFELEETTNGLKIVWRGVGPPVGEVYGGDPNAGCNACHKLAPTNDYVLSPGLRLGGAGDAGVILPDLDASADADTDAGTLPDAGTDSDSGTEANDATVD